MALTMFALMAGIAATLAFKGLLLGKFDGLPVAITLGSSLVYALLSMLIAVRVFHSEKVLFRQ